MEDKLFHYAKKKKSKIYLALSSFIATALYIFLGYYCYEFVMLNNPNLLYALMPSAMLAIHWVIMHVAFLRKDWKERSFWTITSTYYEFDARNTVTGSTSDVTAAKIYFKDVSYILVKFSSIIGPLWTTTHNVYCDFILKDGSSFSISAIPDKDSGLFFEALEEACKINDVNLVDPFSIINAIRSNNLVSHLQSVYEQKYVKKASKNG